MLVLVGHSQIVFYSAASVGVTLFFVLSGYLITRILLERPPLRTFYWRRLVRLVPALVSVVLVVAVVSALRGDAKTLVGALVSLTYVSNWLPSMGVALGSMGHTWSLAVEEQFYALWPLALFAIPRVRPVLVGLVAMIIVIRVVSGLDNPVEFRTTMRADALLLGCLLAMVTWRPSGALAFAAAAVVEILAVTPVGVGGFGFAALASVVLVAWVRGKSSPRWLSGLGRISYGVYLWHLPLYLWFGAVVGAPLALLVAAVSFRWFEEPVRRRLTGDSHKDDARILDAVRPSGDPDAPTMPLAGAPRPLSAATHAA
jgi:peptidoglycan/LPS O-acetylase OafA/YrhL